MVNPRPARINAIVVVSTSVDPPTMNGDNKTMPAKNVSIQEYRKARLSNEVIISIIELRMWYNLKSICRDTDRLHYHLSK